MLKSILYIFRKKNLQADSALGVLLRNIKKCIVILKKADGKIGNIL